MKLTKSVKPKPVRLSENIIQYSWSKRVDKKRRQIFVVRIDVSAPVDSHTRGWKKSAVVGDSPTTMPVYPAIMLEMIVRTNNPVGLFDLLRMRAVNKLDAEAYRYVDSSGMKLFFKTPDLKWQSYGHSSYEGSVWDSDVELDTGRLVVDDHQLRILGLAGYELLQNMMKAALAKL